MSSTQKDSRIGGSNLVPGFGPDVRIEELTAYVHPAEEGGYWAEVPDLPGCVTEADTLDELVVMLNDAIEGWLSVQSRESLTALGVKYKVVEPVGSDAAIGQEMLSRRLPRFGSLKFAA